MSDYLARLHGWLKDAEGGSAVVEDEISGDERVIDDTALSRLDGALSTHTAETGVRRSLPLLSDDPAEHCYEDGTLRSEVGKIDSDTEDKPTRTDYEDEQTFSDYEDEQTYTDYEEEQTYSDFEEDPLKPGDSMSQIHEFDLPNLSLPPTRTNHTPSAPSKRTVGGDKASDYFRALTKTGVVHIAYVASHTHLYDTFEPEGLIASHPADGQTSTAVASLGELAEKVRDGAITELVLRCGMHTILEASFNPPSQDDHSVYVIQAGETWNRIPENTHNEEGLSLPTVDLVICVNFRNAGMPVPFETDLPHPSSSEAMHCVLEAEPTREKAPVKSTRVDMHDSTLLVLKSEGLWVNPTTPGARSEIMEVAQSQALNGMNVQLGSIAQLFLDVPLEGDGEFDRFVLSMTICGDLWTVEYATRPHATRPAPEIFLAALKEVIEQNMINLRDKARRLNSLRQEALRSSAMRPADDPAPKIEICSCSSVCSTRREEHKAASLQSRADESQVALPPGPNNPAGAGTL